MIQDSLVTAALNRDSHGDPGRASTHRKFNFDFALNTGCYRAVIVAQ